MSMLFVDRFRRTMAGIVGLGPSMAVAAAMVVVGFGPFMEIEHVVGG